MKNKILLEITKFCKECPSCECCPEEECVLYRIEKLVERNNKMKKYNVEIEETLSKIISIESETKEEAISKVEEMYDNEEIVLTADDYIDTEFNVIESNNNEI